MSQASNICPEIKFEKFDGGNDYDKEYTSLPSLFVVPISDHVMPLLRVDSFICKYLNKRTILKGMTCDVTWQFAYEGKEVYCKQMEVKESVERLQRN